MKLSARNVFKGTVIDIKPGPVMASVKVDVGGGLIIHAIVTGDAATDLALKPGSAVSAIIKATDVMLATGEG